MPWDSSIQACGCKGKNSIDKAIILSFHVTENIEDKKRELVKAIQEKKSDFSTKTVE